MTTFKRSQAKYVKRLAPVFVRPSRRRAVIMVQATEHRHGDDLARIAAGLA